MKNFILTHLIFTFYFLFLHSAFGDKASITRKVASENSEITDLSDPDQKPNPENEPSQEEKKIESPKNEIQMAELVEKTIIFDRTTHGLSAGFGFIQNINLDGAGIFYSSLFASYEYTIRQRFFFNSNSIQDAIAFEAGLFYYSISNIYTTQDFYQIRAYFLNIKYRLHLNEDQSIYFFGQVIKNTVSSSINQTIGATQYFSLFFANAGAGWMLRFGPGWFIKAEISPFQIGGGIVFRF